MNHKTLQGAFIAIVICMNMPVRGQLHGQDRFPVTQITVKQAIAKNLFHQDALPPGVDVQLLSDVLASTPVAQLQVMAVVPWHSSNATSTGERQFAVRMTCKASHGCMPFYVLVELPAPLERFASVSLPSLKFPADPLPRPKLVLAMRRGGHATLVLDDGVSHIQIPVLSLQDACVGESVRVSTLDHKQTYEGKVISTGLLKGAF